MLEVLKTTPGVTDAKVGMSNSTLNSQRKSGRAAIRATVFRLA